MLSLQDHPAVLSAFYLKEEAGPICLTDELLHSSGRIRVRAIAKFLLFRKGPLTSTGCDHGAFVSTNGACTLLRYEYSTPRDSHCLCHYRKCDANKLQVLEILLTSPHKCGDTDGIVGVLGVTEWGVVYQH